MSKLVTLQATYRIVTPLFLGGANLDQEAELRVPSIKGALRFWWRALRWPRVCGDTKDNAEAFQKLHAEDAALFGSTSSGQGKMLFKIPTFYQRDSSNKQVASGDILRSGDDVIGPGARYLGYGVMEAYDGINTVAGRLTRPAILAPYDFTLQITSREAIPEQVLDALKLLGLLGGLGSKSRKGYGSLTLLKLRGSGVDWTCPQTTEHYIEGLKQFLPGSAMCTDRPEFSAFSSHMRMDLLMNGDNPLVLL
jgi:CRISPR-associated protein Cmr1